MGRKRGSTNALQLRVDQKGKVNYDVVLRDGERKGKHMFTSLAEMEEHEADQTSLAKPAKEDTQILLKKVRQAAEKKLERKIHLFSFQVKSRNEMRKFCWKGSVE